MPSKLQRRLLSKLLGSKGLADKYFNLLIGYPFSTVDGNINYAVGQPMGAYSSWPLMALTHHLIVYTSFGNKKGKYMLLGDDLVISGSQAANLYKRIVELLGMKISPFKTLESKDSFEFAKRFYVNGVDYTPLPIGQLKHANTQYWDIVGFIDQCENRGWSFEHSTARELLCSHLFSGYPKRKKIYMTNLVNKFYHRIDCYKDGWDHDLKWKILKWIPEDEFNFGCNRSNDFLREYILQLYIHVTMELIHENIVKQVKTYNKLAQRPFYRTFRDTYDVYHPLISILHNCAKGLSELEYKASSDPTEETERYYRCKVSVKNFTFIPADISKVISVSGYSKGMKCRTILSDKLKDVILYLETQREFELAGGDPD